MHTAFVIGFGNRGSKRAEAIAAHPQWSLVAICERDPERRSLAAAQFPDARITDKESEVLDAEDIEVGVLCTLADSRPDHIRRCLATGKHIIAEKPLGGVRLLIGGVRERRCQFPGRRTGAAVSGSGCVASLAGTRPAPGFHEVCSKVSRVACA